MTKTFYLDTLSDFDFSLVKRGKCPWCLTRLYDGLITKESKGDICPECGDVFLATKDNGGGI